MFVQEWALPAPVKTPVQEALLQAADYMEKHGWCRGSMSNADGMVCLYGALIHGVADSHISLMARRHLSRYMKVPCPMAWNDLECEGQEQAVAVLRAAAR